MTPLWYEWLCHSNFSFLIGASYPESYVSHAQELSYGGLALTDYDGVYGAVRAYRQHRQYPSTFTKLFHGIEFHLDADHELPLVLRDSLVLLCLNQEGYYQLCRLASEAHRLSKNKPILDLNSLLETDISNLICLQPMRGLIRRPNFDGQRYALLREHFKENFYLVLSRHLNPIEDQWIQPSLGFAKNFDIPLLFSQDAYFHHPQNKDLSDLVQAIRLNKRLDDVVPYLFVNQERCLRPPNILWQRYQVFEDWQKIARNSEMLAERFRFSLQDLSYQYPQEFLPMNYNSQEYLAKIIQDSLSERYPAGASDKIHRLLREELALVDELGFADYFITVWDIVRWARSQGILCQGRGSAANSAICFVIGITALDPDQHEILFERFLSRERGDPPDIDLDFEHERREEVIQYIYERYGRKRAAMVANVISFRSRSAMRAVGKALGIAELWIEQASQSHESTFDRPDPGTKSWPHEEDALQHPKGQNFSSKLWHSLAERLQGFPRHLGVHSGGFVVTQEGLDHLCPQEPSTMPDRTVVQWSKDDIEYLGIFKIDILALGMLTAIRKSLDYMRRYFHADYSLHSLPADDPQTYAMIQKAETVGVFQIESRAQMSMLPRLLPNNFYDLAIQIGIVRPGPIQGGVIHPYLRRRQGLEPITYPDPRLRPVLERTLGLPLFQEQIMRVAIIVGNFSGGEADELRKKIGSWAVHKDLDQLIEKLKDGMLRNKVKPEFVTQIIGHLQGFANYGFPEAHSISFAVLAYASSYIKCHYPEAFYTAILNSQPMGFYSIHALIQSARREGLHFLPPDINYSDWDCSLEPLESSDRIHYAIRLGLRLLRGLSETGAQELLARRAKLGMWLDLKTFLQEPIARRDLTALAAADALRNFGLPRRQALWLMESAPFAPLLDDQEFPYHFQQETELQRLEQDFEAFASSLGQHPSVILREQAWSYTLPPDKLTQAAELKKLVPKQLVHVFGLLLIRQMPPTAKGMMFITLEDETGFMNLVCHPPLIARYRELLAIQGFLCVSGRLQRDQESLSIVVERVHKPDLGLRKIIPLPSTDRHTPPQPKHLPPIRNFR